MAFVYWIHVNDHVDPYSQGYVGVTTKKYLSQRFHEHVQSTKSRRYCPILCNAIDKYGKDSLKIIELFEGSLDECLIKENLYRPKRHIGWNVAIGGQPTQKGVKRPPDQVEKHAKLMKERMKYPWEHPNAKKESWSDAMTAYDKWVTGKGYRSIANLLNKSTYTFAQMCKEFKQGWNPHQCLRWKQEFMNDES